MVKKQHAKGVDSTPSKKEKKFKLPIFQDKDSKNTEKISNGAKSPRGSKLTTIEKESKNGEKSPITKEKSPRTKSEKSPRSKTEKTKKTNSKSKRYTTGPTLKSLSNKFRPSILNTLTKNSEYHENDSSEEIPNITFHNILKEVGPVPDIDLSSSIEKNFKNEKPEKNGRRVKLQKAISSSSKKAKSLKAKKHNSEEIKREDFLIINEMEESSLPGSEHKFEYTDIPSEIINTTEIEISSEQLHVHNQVEKKHLSGDDISSQIQTSTDPPDGPLETQDVSEFSDAPQKHEEKIDYFSENSESIVDGVLFRRRQNKSNDQSFLSPRNSISVEETSNKSDLSLDEMQESFAYFRIDSKRLSIPRIRRREKDKKFETPSLREDIKSKIRNQYRRSVHISSDTIERLKIVDAQSNDDSDSIINKFSTKKFRSKRVEPRNLSQEEFEIETARRYYHRDNINTALTRLDVAIKRLASQEQKEDVFYALACAYYYKADCLLFQNNYMGAEIFSRDSLDILDELTICYAFSSPSTAQLSTLTDDWTLGVPISSRVLWLRRSALELQLAYIMEKQGQYDVSLEWYQRSINSREKMAQLTGIPISYASIACILVMDIKDSFDKFWCTDANFIQTARATLRTSSNYAKSAMRLCRRSVDDEILLISNIVLLEVQLLCEKMSFVTKNRNPNEVVLATNQISPERLTKIEQLRKEIDSIQKRINKEDKSLLKKAKTDSS